MKEKLMCIDSAPSYDTGETCPLTFGKVYTVTSVRFNGGHPHNQMVALDECAIGRYFNVTRFRLLCDDELRFEVE